MIGKTTHRAAAIAAIGFFIAIAAIAAPKSATAAIIVDGATQGFYNAALGTALDFTNPTGATFLFPGANSNPNDPTLDPVPFEPDLSAAGAILGDWLGNPGTLNANWSGPRAIPAAWAVNTETAIVYAIDAGPTGLTNMVASFGIDNGIFVWLDGVFLSGELRPGGTFLGEHVINIGGLAAGTHYLQVLREDHGGATGYAVQITADTATIPTPATWLLFSAGLAALARSRRRHAVA